MSWFETVVAYAVFVVGFDALAVVTVFPSFAAKFPMGAGCGEPSGSIECAGVFVLGEAGEFDVIPSGLGWSLLSSW